MTKPKTKARTKKIGAFGLRPEKDTARALDPATHIYHGGARCETDTRGYPTPGNRGPLDLVVDTSGGIIPLWHQHVTLRWRFQEAALARFLDPEAVKDYVREILGEALMAWGNAVPVKFTEAQEAWDFEIVIRDADNCSLSGCTLARAFFPDAGQHELILFPRMFEQVRQEQIETMAHELGHIFGLRHFFAEVSETAFPSEIFGDHDKFTIMNYGPESTLTDTDIADLERLYALVWSRELTQINGTEIRLFHPFSAARHPLNDPTLLGTRLVAEIERYVAAQ